MTIRSEEYKVRSIKPLEKEAALSAGADFIGEAFIFGVGGAIVVWEYNRSKEKDRCKEEQNVERERMQEKRLLDVENSLERIDKGMEEFIQMERERHVRLFEPEITRKREWLS